MIPLTDDMNPYEENSEDLHRVIAILLESNTQLKNKIRNLEHKNSSKSCNEAEYVSGEYGHVKSGYYLSQKLDKFLKVNKSCKEAEELSSRNCEEECNVSAGFRCAQSGSYKSKERKTFLEVKKSCNEAEKRSSKNCEIAGNVSNDFGCVQSETSGSYKSKDRKKIVEHKQRLQKSREDRV